jgi:hypothetical protein
MRVFPFKGKQRLANWGQAEGKLLIKAEQDLPGTKRRRGTESNGGRQRGEITQCMHM